jgi:mRNA interferase MazF
MAAPARGDNWWVDLDPVRGHEQPGRRPALVLSSSAFNRGPRGLIAVMPMTRAQRGYVFHIQTGPSDTCLSSSGAIMVDQLRFVAVERFLNQQPAGGVDRSILARVETLLKAALDMP